MNVKDVKAFAWGAIIGTLGGLIGLGGAEFRLPADPDDEGLEPRLKIDAHGYCVNSNISN